MIVIDELSRRLAPEGWALAAWEEDDDVTFVRQHDADISFQLGLDVTPRGWGLSLNPSLGVMHAEVSRLHAQFLGVPGGGCMTGATFLDLLRNAMPSEQTTWWRRWAVGVAAGPEAEIAAADRVIADLHVYGEPFLAARSNLDDIVAQMAADERRTQLDDAYLAVAYALMGDLTSARRALRDVAVKAETRPLLVRSDSDRFICHFRSYFEIEEA